MDWVVGFLAGVGALSIVVYVIGFFVQPRRSSVAEAWECGFTSCANEHARQRTDPSHPITRRNPHRPTP